MRVLCGTFDLRKITRIFTENCFPTVFIIMKIDRMIFMLLNTVPDLTKAKSEESVLKIFMEFLTTRDVVSVPVSMPNTLVVRPQSLSMS